MCYSGTGALEHYYGAGTIVRDIRTPRTFTRHSGIRTLMHCDGV